MARRGEVYPNGDYYLSVDPGLCFGTFGHPWERTLSVWGAGLLAAVEERLTRLLGEPLRRRDGAGTGTARAPGRART